jgi:hypothetical protein
MNLNTKPQISAISRLLSVAGHLSVSHIKIGTYKQPSVLAIAVSGIQPHILTAPFQLKKDYECESTSALLISGPQLTICLDKLDTKTGRRCLVQANNSQFVWINWIRKQADVA